MALPYVGDPGPRFSVVSRIFLSHSSADLAEATALRDWLVAEGWDDLFLDVDPDRGLRAGERWQSGLKRANERCEAVVLVLSPSWAESRWCLAEYLLASQLNKRIVGALVKPTPLEDLPSELTAEWQLVDLTAGGADYEADVTLEPHGARARVRFSRSQLDRLRTGLIQWSLEPRSFTWPPEGDPDRPPYRGLRCLEAEDAGILFGRDGPVMLASDALRGLRSGVPPRLMVILGASGAGKSSFMRAGLLPRLAREDHHFLPLPVLRPERAPITGEHGLIATLEEALRDAGGVYAKADVRDRVSSGPQAVVELVGRLVEGKAQTFPGEDRPRPTAILPIDQAEELFQAGVEAEANQLLEIVHALSASDTPGVIVLFTVRSDSYEPLQSARQLDGLRQQTFGLPPIPRGTFGEIVMGPIKRLEGTDRAIVLEETLVDALLSDVDRGAAKDALPLLNFTLERLYREYGGSKRLTREQYCLMGGVKGSIEAALEQALAVADSSPSIPRDPVERMALLRQGLIPWLAELDHETGAPSRRIAKALEIPLASRPLIELLVDQRLLASDVSAETGETTIEPAHEALLRQWTALRDWLAEDSGRLAVLDGVKRAARLWDSRERSTAWLAHATERLVAAESLKERPDLVGRLSPTDWEYLAKCREVEDTAARRTLWRRFTMAGLMLGILCAALGWAYQDALLMELHRLTRVAPYTLSPGDISRLRPGGVFWECKKSTASYAVGCPAMVVIPAGRFAMGRPGLALTENGSLPNDHSADLHESKEGVGDYEHFEWPQREVIIARPLAVSRSEVTFDQWDTCFRLGACENPGGAQDWGRGKRPVINISWHDAQQYAAWLSSMTGANYRLLTEAEWEYAARAGEPAEYSWGSGPPKGKAHCRDCSTEFTRGTVEVESFPPNRFGLFDMHGNVWEWVEDCFSETPERAPVDGSASLSGNCRQRVIRGGSWYDRGNRLRSAHRYRDDIEGRFYATGFRLARTLGRGSAPDSP